MTPLPDLFVVDKPFYEYLMSSPKESRTSLTHHSKARGRTPSVQGQPSGLDWRVPWPIASVLLPVCVCPRVFPSSQPGAFPVGHVLLPTPAWMIPSPPRSPGRFAFEGPAIPLKTATTNIWQVVFRSGFGFDCLLSPVHSVPVFFSPIGSHQGLWVVPQFVRFC